MLIYTLSVLFRHRSRRLAAPPPSMTRRASLNRCDALRLSTVSRSSQRACGETTISRRSCVDCRTWEL